MTTKTKPKPINWSTLTPHKRDALVAEHVTMLNVNVRLRRSLLPNYTECPTAALQVVEEMRKRKLPVVILSYGGNSYWGVGFGDFPRMDCPTLPEAICLAALRACGVEVEQ